MKKNHSKNEWQDITKMRPQKIGTTCIHIKIPFPRKLLLFYLFTTQSQQVKQVQSWGIFFRRIRKILLLFLFDLPEITTLPIEELSE
jgi:hypothetical protein